MSTNTTTATPATATATATATPATGVGSHVDSITTVGSTDATGIAAVAHGATVIADSVVASIVGIAARNAAGVFALGGNAARALGAVRGAIGGTDLAQGIRVEVGATKVAVDVSIVAEYPTPLQAVADRVRASVASAIENLVGLEVAGIDVAIVDVHIPNDSATEAETRRVA